MGVMQQRSHAAGDPESGTVTRSEDQKGIVMGSEQQRLIEVKVTFPAEMREAIRTVAARAGMSSTMWIRAAVAGALTTELGVRWSDQEQRPVFDVEPRS